MATWNLDASHSEIQFKVKHLMITNVTGSFNTFSASVSSADDVFSNATIAFEADILSIDTANEQRDGHLKSADFFDAANHPKLTFRAEGFNAAGGKVTGDLTIRGTTRKVTFDVEFHGTNRDPWGQTKAGFSLSGKINRTDFGLNWNAALETGGVLVAEEVKLMAEAQFVKQA